MSGPPRVRSANTATEMEARSVLGPAGNKVPTKPASKSTKKPVQQTPEGKDKEKVKELLTPQKKPTPAPQSLTLTASILRQQERMAGNFSMSLSCLSDGGASSSSAGSSSSGMTGGGGRRGGKHGIGVGVRRKQSGPKGESGVIVVDSWEGGCLDNKKRCGWVTTNSDLCYVAFHDEEWGVPAHDDKKLFELLSLSGALAELTWPTILSKRHLFRDTFLEFDPRAVSKLSEKKIGAPGSPASSLLSELKIRGIIENGHQICKVIDEFGSFDKYIWSFVNHKPIVGQFRYPRQVPVKSPKSEVISKDLIRRGFRSVGPTVVYSFMQVAGLTNDHLMSCFRFQECITGVESRGKVNNDEANDETKKVEETTALG
ncbi:hypothetical protein ERO13_A05G119400v2 [Gossypium hirsutum]|uniref:Uncharacterized protein n=3 Tax=Gossypium TaxID=3633 RepID=A0A5J5VN74_GOSBA|nr:probable GMP synthase [glutamine-hydrolyzing] [Gossypium hirsutum]KAB2081340.1 hypothetical protein ES319_A05G124700v1 [Gossypium barbadense]KAG4198972.1 hypothetical protein ERO13_A05G119400v2 [Gossypium hirsutum]TYJ33800.1 hypothetical protein E1A91_A05G126900v1 [Gossypium mustelinum]